MSHKRHMNPNNTINNTMSTIKWRNEAWGLGKNNLA